MIETWTLEADREASPPVGELQSHVHLNLAVPPTSSQLVTLYDGAVGTLLLARCARTDQQTSPPGYIENPHFVLPLCGSYVWHSAQGEVFADANRVLCFSGRQSYATSHPVSGDVSMAFMPNPQILEQMFGGRVGETHRLAFETGRSWSASFDLQLLARRLVHEALADSPIIAIEEKALALIPLLIADHSTAREDSLVSKRAIVRAKEFMQAHGQGKLTLGDVADAVGLNPVYLSQMFTKAEGMPLYKYMRKLRLVAALNSLKGCADITDLAFEGGFSSHSHFTAAFNNAFHQTPSTVRGLFNRHKGARHPTHLRTRDLCLARGGILGPSHRPSTDLLRRQAS